MLDPHRPEEALWFEALLDGLRPLSVDGAGKYAMRVSQTEYHDAELQEGLDAHLQCGGLDTAIYERETLQNTRLQVTVGQRPGAAWADPAAVWAALRAIASGTLDAHTAAGILGASPVAWLEVVRDGVRVSSLERTER